MKNIITHFGLKHVIMYYMFLQHCECVRSSETRCSCEGEYRPASFLVRRVLRCGCVCSLLLVGDMEVLIF